VRPESLVGGNQYRRDDGTLMDAVKTTSIASSPQVLILHLKRSAFDVERQERHKIDDMFAISATIDISPYAIAPVAPYVLRGAIVHVGCACSGHYISYINENSRWLRFDDICVSEIATEEVYRVAQGYQEGSGSAYILFYERQHAIQPGRLPPEPPELSIWNEQLGVERFFCSTRYFTFMTEIADQASIIYQEIVMRYVVDSLMFSTLSNGIPQFFDSLTAKIVMTQTTVCNAWIKYFTLSCRHSSLNAGSRTFALGSSGFSKR
jgi:hypothetical protein